MRRQMVRRQLASRGIRSRRVLEVMGRIPRECFLPASERARAYDDTPLPIGFGATISQPYIVALMTEALDPQPGERILEVGTGSGYQTAILAELSDQVHTLEIVPELSAQARATLQELGYDGLHFQVCDGRKGWPEYPHRSPGRLLRQVRSSSPQRSVGCGRTMVWQDPAEMDLTQVLRPRSESV